MSEAEGSTVREVSAARRAARGEEASRWPRWMRPPVLPREDETARARVLHWILTWALIFFTVTIPLQPLLSDAPWRATAVHLATIVVIAIGILALRRSLSAAGMLVVISAFVMAAVGSVTTGGSASATTGGFPLIVLAAGLFLDGRRAVWAALACTAVLVGIAFAESSGWLPQPEPPGTFRNTFDHVIQVLVSLVLVGAGLRSLRRSQDQTRREARRNARLIERSPDGIFELDEDGCVELFNPAAERLSGQDAKDVVGRPLWELNLVSPRDTERGRELLTRAFQEGSDEAFEVEVIRSDGERVPVELLPRRVVRADGGIGVMATVRDLRPRRRGEAERDELEEQLHRMRRLESVGRLAGGVAHDFNNLLTVMLSNAQLLLGESKPGPHWREDVEQIRDAATRASDLTQQLLAFARRETLAPQVLDLNEPLWALRDLVGRLCGEAVRLDRSRLEQVVMNLAANARDAMGRSGVLTIRTSRLEVESHEGLSARGMPPGEYVWLRVQDDGTGIDPDTLPHIFEPFFSTKRSKGGTGLGLATVHGIVSQSGGFIFVESTLGTGTAFDIFFPAVRDGKVEEIEALPSWRADPPPLADATILLVEDEAVVGRITKRVLEERGYEVLWAAGLEEARAAWAERSEDIDLLLSDVIMPDGLGPELARELRGLKPELTVMYMSGYDDEALGDSFGSESSGLTLVRKPFSIERLVELVAAALEGRPPPSGRVSWPAGRGSRNVDAR